VAGRSTESLEGMKTIQIAAATILLSSFASAYAACLGHPVVTTQLDDGSKVGIVVKEAQFKKAPAWAPSKGEPPLSISKVVIAAEKWAKTEYASYDSARIHSVDLTEFGCNDDPRYWYYLVHFLPMKNGQPSFGGHFIAVLLDGTVIGPTRIK
jgi:hypothetical protein